MYANETYTSTADTLAVRQQLVAPFLTPLVTEMLVKLEVVEHDTFIDEFINTLNNKGV